MEQAGTLGDYRRQLQLEGRRLLEEIADLESSKDYVIEDLEIWRIRVQHLELKFRLLDHLEKVNPEPEQAREKGGPADSNNN